MDRPLIIKKSKKSEFLRRFVGQYVGFRPDLKQYYVLIACNSSLPFLYAGLGFLRLTAKDPQTSCLALKSLPIIKHFPEYFRTADVSNYA